MYDIYQCYHSGSIPYTFESEEVAAWIAAEEARLPSDCRLSKDERGMATVVSLAGSSSYSMINNAMCSFNLLFLNEIKKQVDIKRCIQIRVISTTTDIIRGMPVIRQHGLVHKIPSYFDIDGFVDHDIICTGCNPPGQLLFGIGRLPSGDSNCKT